MKKILFTLLLILVTTFSFSQTFVHKYTSVITSTGNVKSDWKDISLTVVFNEKKTDAIIFYYSDGSKRTFYQVGDLRNDKTNSGESYQIITCIDEKDGDEVYLQLFDETATLRVLVGDDSFVEFHK